MNDTNKIRIVENSDGEVTELVTLWSFIEKFQKTFAVIGIFIVVGLFWKSNSPNGEVPYIYYLCFLITIPLFVEVWRDFKFDKSDWNLVIFFSLFSGIVFSSVFELISGFPKHRSVLIAGVISIAVVGGIGQLCAVLLDRLDNWFLNKLNQRLLKEVQKVDEKHLPLDERNEILKIIKRKLESDYKLFRYMGGAGLVCVLILGLLFSSYYVYNPVRAIIDPSSYSNEEITVPPVVQ
jgi:hypothetical protein